jgi:hypothetical protein
MADVEMTDAAPKKAKAGASASASGDTDGKKRFEVKKVTVRTPPTHPPPLPCWWGKTTTRPGKTSVN